eukprot:comp13059_c0_seq1/m.8343 comp13059_c0_seq1/g.8343  ORF comp13059_c0_seq1/g.8343 comp13059_c0_seq1/m.8343 type:complete len:191 (-) comp13059_c0_seq1:205-777(-)
MLWVLVWLLGVGLALPRVRGEDVAKSYRIQPNSVYRSSVEYQQFVYFVAQTEGNSTVFVVSTNGDADVYVAGGGATPTIYNYFAMSATCGTEVIHIPEELEQPIVIGIYGYAPPYEPIVVDLAITDHRYKGDTKGTFQRFHQSEDVDGADNDMHVGLDSSGGDNGGTWLATLGEFALNVLSTAVDILLNI